MPGLVISQHSGEGKANQYYLRGFNLDHGFDFGQTIAGIPVNMPTHAHAQGYADANFLIPELVSGVQFRKGPYYAENGDFSSAGSANINYFNVLDRPMVSVSGGSFGYSRFFGAASPRVGPGNLLAAFEFGQDDGPWESPNSHDKYNGVLRYSQGNARNGLSLTFLGFSNHWHSTDQIPQRAVDSGQIGRFGFIEETDGGETYRYSGALDWQRSSTNDSTRLTAYVQRYGVQLFHNFTYFLNDPVNGDQFEQFEERWTSGAKLTHRLMRRIGGKPTENAFGVDVRNDSVGGPLGLYRTRATERLQTVRADEADQLSVGMFADTEIEWSRTFRTTLGVRGDVYRWNVAVGQPDQLRRRRSPASSTPRCRRPSGRGRGTEFYANWGLGFHSNSALGITLQVDPTTGEPATAAPAFARAQGAEFGVRTVALRGLQTTATVWYLGFDSELIYVGDSGSTEDGPASPENGHRDHQLHLSEPMAGDGSGPVVFARAVHRRAGGRGLRSRRPQPGDLRRHRRQPARRRQRRTVRQHPGAAFRSARPDRGQRRQVEVDVDRQRRGRLQVLRAGPAGARRLQPARRQGIGHRLLLRIAAARRSRAGRGHPLPRSDSALGADRAAGVVLGGSAARPRRLAGQTWARLPVRGAENRALRRRC